MKISIIVPIYKVEYNSLRTSINSLINQTYRNIEIILIDDGSPDDCGKICDELQNIDNRIKVIHQNNKGLSGARNAGINISTGDFITFLDGDDWLELDAVEKLIEKMDLNSDVICFGTIKEFKNINYNYDFGDHFIDGKIYENDEIYYMMSELLDFNSYLGDATAKLFKNDLLQKYKLNFDEGLKQGIEGLDFNFRVFEKTKKIQFLKIFKYHYTYSSDSITMRFNEDNYKLIINGFKKIKKIIDEKNMTKYDIVHKYYSRIYYFIITTAISGYFRPKNNLKFKDKKKKFKTFLKNDLIKDVLERNYDNNLDKKRKIIIKLIKKHCYLSLSILAWIRWLQKHM